MSGLDKLEFYAGLFRFVRVTERWIEGRHAVGKSIFASSPHAGAVHLSFHIVLNTLRVMLSENAEVLGQLAAACEKSRHIVAQLERVGFRKHPVVRKIREKPGGKRSLHKDKVHG